MANSSRSRGRGSGSRHPARRPSLRSAAQPHPKSTGASGRPSGSQDMSTDPYGSGFSAWVAKKTGFLLYWLSQRPRWLLPIAVAALFLIGLLWVPWGAIALVLLVILISWLNILSWPSLTTSGRIIRVLFVVGLLIYAVVEVTVLHRK